MIGRPMLMEVASPTLSRSLLVEVRRSDFSRLSDGLWVEGDEEDLAARGVNPRNVVAVIRNRVRAYFEDGRRLTGLNCGFFEDQDDVIRFLESQGARVLAAVEV